MADVIRLNHGVLSEIGQTDRGVSFFAWISKHVSDVERKWDRAGVNETEMHEQKYKIQAYLIKNVMFGSSC